MTRFTAAIAALAAAALVGCSDSMVQPKVSLRSPAGSPGRLITPVLSDVIVGTGTFANAINPTNVGRATGAFWDNHSSDEGNPFPYGTGVQHRFLRDRHDQPDVQFHRASDRRQVATPTTTAAAPATWAHRISCSRVRTRTTCRLSGAYSFGFSTVGWFTKSGGVYTLHAVPQWGAKNMGVAITVNTGGLDWGFFASNANFTGTRTCGATINTTCSDATGGFLASPQQQHALFINGAGNQFLVGLEDNLLGLWAGDNPITNPTNQDSDYQDYIFNIVPHVIAPPLCDFITFGRLVTQVGGDKIVISGNAGGNAPGGGILGTIEISVGGVQYHVPTVETYALPTSGVLFGDPFARVITGHSGTHLIELRLRDNPNPGQGEPTDEGDKVWLKIDNTVVVPLQTPDQGNIQLHLHCRGPGE